MRLGYLFSFLLCVSLQLSSCFNFLNSFSPNNRILPDSSPRCYSELRMQKCEEGNTSTIFMPTGGSASKMYSDRLSKSFSSIGKELVFSHVKTDKKHIRIYACSDLHADTQRNQDWVRANCVRSARELEYENDIFSVFILPGDIGTELDRLSAIFEILMKNYDAVAYCIGNHECWRRGTASGGSSLSPEKRDSTTNRLAEDSVQKVIEVLQCAKAHGVCCGPIRIESTTASSSDPGSIPSSAVILPLQSWYHSGWDTEQDITNPAFLEVQEVMPFERKWGDFHQCTWPGLAHEQFASIKDNDKSLSYAFADLNEPFLYPQAHSIFPSEVVNKKEELLTSPDRGELIIGGGKFTFDSDGQLIEEDDLTTIGSVASSSPASSTASPPTKKPASTKDFEKSLQRFRTETANVNNNSAVLEDTPTNRDENTDELIPSSPIVKSHDTVISFSHFVPRQELMPEKRFLIEPHLTKVIGSDPLEEQIRRLQPHIHLFGHTHIPIDMELDGITYIQWPLGYYKESEKQCKPIYQTGPLLVHDSALGQGKQGIPKNRPSLTTWWTRYYEEHARDPTIEDLSPWLISRLNEFAGLVKNAQKAPNKSAPTKSNINFS